MMGEAQKNLIKNQRKTWYAISEYILGKVYSQVSTGPKPELSVVAKNIISLVQNAPLAGKKAEEHFIKTIALSKELGAEGFLGKSYLDLGLFYKDKKKNQQAHNYIYKAIKLFEKWGAEGYLKQAKEALESLK